MGSWEWACTGCGQKQTARAPNGEAFALRLCAACAEKAAEKVGLIETDGQAVENDHTREKARPGKAHR